MRLLVSALQRQSLRCVLACHRPVGEDSFYRLVRTHEKVRALIPGTRLVPGLPLVDADERQVGRYVIGIHRAHPLPALTRTVVILSVPLCLAGELQTASLKALPLYFIGKQS